MRSVRVVKEVVQVQTTEKLVGSLTTGEEFFCYEFGATLLKARKGSKLVSTEEVPPRVRYRDCLLTSHE
jgi:hypothetical protein